MLQLNEGICYSPRPNVDYHCAEFFKGGGLAAFFGDDLQMWNLAWLCEPGWDNCLNLRSSNDAIVAMQALDPTLAGLCKRALTVEDDITDWGQPSLRDLLRLPPRDFMRALSAKNLMTLELTATYGTPLIQTMWSRARMSQPITADAEVAQFVERAMGNVIPFRRK